MDGSAGVTRGNLSRRALLGLAGGGIAMLGACGGAGTSLSTPTPVPDLSTLTARITGFDDPARWTGRTLRVGAWGGEIQAALSERVFQPFGAATGCQVQEYGAGYDDLATSVAAGSPYLDVMIGDGFWAETALTSGLALPLAVETVPLARIAPIPPAAGAIPAYAYAMTAGFRRDAVDDADRLDGWRDWSDSEVYPGGRALPSQAFATLEIALLADGVEPENLYPLDVNRALARLAKLAPVIEDRWWSSGDQPARWLSRRRADFAAAWHYRLVDAQRDGYPVDYVWSEALLIADYWIIAAGSPVPDVAADFLRYATSPEIQASLATAAPLGPIAPEAFAFIDPRIARRLPTAPERVASVIPVDTAWWAANGVDARDRFDTWLNGVRPNAA